MTTTFLNLIFDTVVFVLTLAKTYHHVKEMQDVEQISIAEVLLRDGLYTPYRKFLDYLAHLPRPQEWHISCQ